MGSPENYSYVPPEQLSITEMREVLFANGWNYTLEEGIGAFSRSYPRVNEALEGHSWREAVLDFSSVLREMAPQASGGLALGMSGGETEITVELQGDQESRRDVTQAFVMDLHLRRQGFEKVDEGRLFDWLKLKGEPGAPRPGTKEYYEQQPRSAALRGLCLQVIDNYIEVVTAEGVEGEAMSKLIELNQALADLAIESDMHADAKPVDFVDPITRSERIAGILRRYLQEGQGFAGNARAMVEEHNLIGGEGSSTAAIALGSNEQASKMIFFLMRLTGLAQHLGAEPEEA